MVIPEKLGDLVIPQVGEIFIYQSDNGSCPELNGQAAMVFDVRPNKHYPDGFAIGLEFADSIRFYVRIKECLPAEED